MTHPAPCFRCQGPVASRDNVREWEFLGSLLTCETETIATRSIRVQMTTVSHRNGHPRPLSCDERIPLCRDCYLAVSRFIGIGVRPDNRLAKETA